MKKLLRMREALEDPAILGGAIGGPTWRSWRILLIAAVGEELTPDEREVSKILTGRDSEPGCMVDTWLTIAGRRSGKSQAMAVLVVYLATLCDWSAELSFERGVALIVAPSERQAANILHFHAGPISRSKARTGDVSAEAAASAFASTRPPSFTLPTTARTATGSC